MVARLNPAATAPIAHTVFILFLVFFIFIWNFLFSPVCGLDLKSISTQIGGKQGRILPSGTRVFFDAGSSRQRSSVMSQKYVEEYLGSVHTWVCPPVVPPNRST